MGGLGIELDVQVTEGDMGHGICVHIQIIAGISHLIKVKVLIHPMPVPSCLQYPGVKKIPDNLKFSHSQKQIY